MKSVLNRIGFSKILSVFLTITLCKPTTIDNDARKGDILFGNREKTISNTVILRNRKNTFQSFSSRHIVK